MTNLKCLVLEKLELNVKNYFPHFRKKKRFLQNISKNTGDANKKVLEYRIVAFLITKILLCMNFLENKYLVRYGRLRASITLFEPFKLNPFQN